MVVRMGSGNCLWSPISTTRDWPSRFNFVSATNKAGSVLCVVSSTRTKSNSILRSISLAVPVLVAQINLAAVTRDCHSAGGCACNRHSLRGSVESAPTRSGDCPAADTRSVSTSTALLLNAHSNTLHRSNVFCLRFKNCSTMAAATCVFPEPGGP